jgi:hypothetical protein
LAFAVFINPRFMIKGFDIFFIFLKLESNPQVFSHVIFRHFSPLAESSTGIIRALPAMLNPMRSRAFLIMAALVYYPEADSATRAARTMDFLGRQIQIQVFFPSPTQGLSLVEFFVVFLEGLAGVAGISAGRQFHLRDGKMAMVPIPPGYEENL